MNRLKFILALCVCGVALTTMNANADRTPECEPASVKRNDMNPGGAAGGGCEFNKPNPAMVMFMCLPVMNSKCTGTSSHKVVSANCDEKKDMGRCIMVAGQFMQMISAFSWECMGGGAAAMNPCQCRQVMTGTTTLTWDGDCRNM